MPSMKWLHSSLLSSKGEYTACLSRHCQRSSLLTSPSVMWCEEHIWNVSVLQRVYIFNCVFCEELLPTLPKPKLEDYSLSAVRNCLFNIFATTLHIWSPSFICNLKIRCRGKSTTQYGTDCCVFTVNQSASVSLATATNSCSSSVDLLV
jgi:hypothetical protein